MSRLISKFTSQSFLTKQKPFNYLPSIRFITSNNHKTHNSSWKQNIIYGAAFGTFFTQLTKKKSKDKTESKTDENNGLITNLSSPEYYKSISFDINSNSFKNKKFIYQFNEGNKNMNNILGGKGANLCEMTKLGIKVPPGFTITTEVCAYYNETHGKFPNENEFWDNIFNKKNGSLKYIENELDNGSQFGNNDNPLLVSVRSGAAQSMPGMMDTILNLGLNDKSVKSVAKLTNNERFAYDSYRRLIQMFGNVVMGMDSRYFEKELETIKHNNGYTYDTELTVNDLKELINKYKIIYKKLDKNNNDFPQNANEQLRLAIEAVFKSWNTERAIAYRNINHLNNKGLLGTAVNVQAMVFGNKGENSGTGVCFTRNPSDGSKQFYGEFLMNAQGEDVVSGIRTPIPISELQILMPTVYNELVSIYHKLEEHYHDMQDMEFTIENGQLYLLQTRTGKRTAKAAIKIAVDMVNEGLISKKDALMRIKPTDLDKLLHKQFNDIILKKQKPIAKGLPASPGVAVGKIVFDAKTAKEWYDNGEKVILVRNETSPEDIIGMNASQGILTLHGGMTSHAAVVARGMGKCCISGCNTAKIHDKSLLFECHKVLKEGDIISLDGSTGKIYSGKIPVIDVNIKELKNTEFGIIMNWANEYKKLGIRTNADTPHDTQIALDLGANGIGLTRTEHQFFDKNRIKLMREMILLNKNDDKKKNILKQLKNFQKTDFEGIYNVMRDKTVTIRLLDPPLHEFLKTDMPVMEKYDICKDLNITPTELDSFIDELKETNPMLGHRGCRLGITHPEITIMQIESIIEAAINVSLKEKILIEPEIMIPFIGHKNELILQTNLIRKVAQNIIDKSPLKNKMKFKVGTMIEIPRAAITSDEISKYVDFYSFGTNDLTQMTLGCSRDDSQSSFLNDYVNKYNIYESDPFQVLDIDGVGKLIDVAVKLGKLNNDKLTIGICGEHGGNPESIKFFNDTGFDYVSCSPYRVPVAILAAAQAQIEKEKENENDKEN